MSNVNIISKIAIITVCMTTPFVVSYAQSVEQLLVKQIYLGEISYRDDLLNQSLSKLERMNPKHPEILAARLRLSLKQGDIAKARLLLRRLEELAPKSTIYLRSNTLISLELPENKKKLQLAFQAELNGDKRSAFQYYRSLFHDDPPTVELAVKYWWACSGLPGQDDRALGELRKLDAEYPGNGTLQSYLASLLYKKGLYDESFNFLELMSTSPGTASMAATKWLVYIEKLPSGNEKIRALKRFISFFNTGEIVATAKNMLIKQETDSSSGKRMADSQDNHEEKMPAQTLARNPVKNNSKNDGYQNLIRTATRYLKENKYSLAEFNFKKALLTSKANYLAQLGLGQTAAARGDYDASISFFNKVLKHDNKNKIALTGIASILSKRTTNIALQWFDTLSYGQRKLLISYEKRWISEKLENEASICENKEQWMDAIILHKKRLKMYPGNFWIVYRIAMDYRRLNKYHIADHIITEEYNKISYIPFDVNHAYAMYMINSEQLKKAGEVLSLIVVDNEKKKNIRDGLYRKLYFKEAYALREKDNNLKSINFLREKVSGSDVDLFVAETYFKSGDHRSSKEIFSKLLEHGREKVKAISGLIKIAIVENKPDEVYKLLDNHGTKLIPPELQLKVAEFLSTTNYSDRSDAIYNDLIASKNIESPLAYRDFAKYAVTKKQTELAKRFLQKALLSSDSSQKLDSVKSVTSATKIKNDDGWLIKSIKNDISSLYKQQDTIISVGLDDKQSNGTPGYSDTHTTTSILHMDTPFSGGKFFTQIDVVSMDAGSFNQYNARKWYQKFGTCKSLGCSGYESQNSKGVSYASGWKNAIWGWDLGTTPLGFDVVNWNGGLWYTHNLSAAKMNYSIHRRPLSNSVLSFSGRRDPNTGITWGGVQATGININASYDKGEGNGIWLQLNTDLLTGDNVADNNRIRLMGGNYYRFINTSDKQLQLGLSSSLWHYQKNLSEYTIGQGGYYSPQSYFSIGTPLIYRQRTERWSFEFGGNISWSRAKTDDTQRYPLKTIMPVNINDLNVVDKGGESSGFGYSASVKAEYRVTSHWSIGSSVVLKKTDDYTPSHALLYVKYRVDGWDGNMDMPLKVITPYSEYR